MAVVRPEHGDTTWFVPALADQTLLTNDGALVVNRRSHDSGSRKTLSGGLPRTDCSDLIYRHGLALSPAACGW